MLLHKETGVACTLQASAGVFRGEWTLPDRGGEDVVEQHINTRDSTRAHGGEKDGAGGPAIHTHVTSVARHVFCFCHSFPTVHFDLRRRFDQSGRTKLPRIKNFSEITDATRTWRLECV
jgi:hypothetical protein